MDISAALLVALFDEAVSLMEKNVHLEYEIRQVAERAMNTTDEEEAKALWRTHQEMIQVLEKRAFTINEIRKAILKRS